MPDVLLFFCAKYTSQIYKHQNSLLREVLCRALAARLPGVHAAQHVAVDHGPTVVLQRLGPLPEQIRVTQ